MDDVTPEEWRAVVGYERRYEVSSLGRVRSTVRNPAGKALAGWTLGNGYQMVTIGGRTGKQRYVHHLVAEAFIGPRPPGLEVRHLDGNPQNNRWAPGETAEEVMAAGGNLFYGTSSENKYDIVRHGNHFQASKTQCDRGHDFTPENTYVNPSKPGNNRTCRICSADSKRRYKARKKAERVEAQALISSQMSTWIKAS